MLMKKEMAQEAKERLWKERNTEIRWGNYAVIHEVWKDGESEAIKSSIMYFEQVEKQKKQHRTETWEQAAIILLHKT